MTMVELTVGIVILAMLMSVLIRHLLTTYNSTRDHKDRVFAYSKAQAILAEVQSYIDTSGIGHTVNLDNLNDNGKLVPTLTIKTSGGALVAPDHPLSENIARDGGWLWSRSIAVQGFAGVDNRDLRYVTVRIYKKVSATQDLKVADVSTVVNATSGVYPTTQVFDVFFLDVENIPGWWVDMESIRPFTEGLLDELQSRNPGMEFRTHWISKASYGRNPSYKPYLNVAKDSTFDIPYVYYYPGKMPTGLTKAFDYAPTRFNGQLCVDGVTEHGYDATTNPMPYALADYWNHAMRYPREKRFHDARVAAIRQRKLDIQKAEAAATPAPPPYEDMSEEPTLRLFLEDLSRDPLKYQNAIILNLHGELLPVPALRNYSDAAKAPDVLPGIRVVTHPEELRTHKDKGNATADHARFRIHAYVTDPTGYTGPKTIPWNATAVHPIMLKVMGVDLTDPAAPDKLHPDVHLRCLEGGVVLAGVAGTDVYKPMADARNYYYSTMVTALDKARMFYNCGFYNGPGEDKYTLIYLYNTPCVSPAVNDGSGIQGISATKRARLYDMEYVPGPVEGALDFSNDLAAYGTGPKNTARWVLDIGPGVLTDARFVAPDGTYYEPKDDVVLTVQTRIYNTLSGSGSPLYTGVTWPVPNQPENFSETYTWWASSPDAVPVTERYQFQGDPRHVPYKDMMHGDKDFPDHYNWYFDDLVDGGNDATVDYPGLDAKHLAAGWDGRVRQDLPRYHQLLRQGIIQGHCLFNTMTGWSFYYMGVGNEVEADVNQRPYGSPGVVATIKQVFTGFRYYVRGPGSSGTYWMSLPWLGELFPDSAYSGQWGRPDADGFPVGNLVAGNGATEFYQTAQSKAYAGTRFQAWGTKMIDGQQQASSLGCVSFFNADNGSGNTFQHSTSSGNGNLLPYGVEIATRYGIGLPTQANITRPFSLTTSMSNHGDQWDWDPYKPTRGTVSMLRDYYDHPKADYGAALLELTDNAATDSGFMVINGFARSTEWGTDMIAKFAVLALLHSYFEVGTSGLPSRMLMPPRVEIESPTIITELINPSTVDVKYDIEWKRWDGQAYTGTTSVGFAEDESQIYYAMYYSKDMGRTWLYVQDDSLALIGRPPTNAYYKIPDWNTGAGETFSLATPAAKFPRGTYLIRIEAYREGQVLHYSHHTVQCFIDR
ncbi:MAG: hypothetical protein R3F30_09855 [Planctomycetota bacterium]